MAKMMTAGMDEKWTKATDKLKASGKGLLMENRVVQAVVAKKWSIIMLAMAFLLGRAMILEELAPFAIAYFAVIYFLRKDLLLLTGATLIAGSILAQGAQTGILIAELVVFLFMLKGLERFERAGISFAPVLVFTSSFLTHTFYLIVTDGLTWYSMLMAVVEAILSFVLTLIFIQAIPVFTLSRKNYNLKNEEIICLIILLASVMTGLVGWSAGSLSLDHIMSRYLILLFALVGGSPMGASVGVVTGLILSLARVDAIYQMSLLAFAGMLAGLLREGRRMAVGLGMLLGSSILSVYMGNQTDVMSSTWESVVAVALFLLTPRSVIQTIAKYVPGTQEHLNSQNDYAKRIRDLTAGRVQQFSEVFRQLSKSFIPMTSMAGAADEMRDEKGHFMNAVAAQSCDSCHKQRYCWNDKFQRTYSFMTDAMTEVDKHEAKPLKKIPKEWKDACQRTDHVLDVMRMQYQMHQHDQHWKKQIQDSRQIVADQLFGVSQVMEDLAKEIRREGQELFMQEEQIRQTLEELGLSIHSIDVISLDEGNVEIEIIHQYTKGFDECRKIIAPLLTDILGEHIAVKSEQYSAKGTGYYTVVFGSAKEYEVETGIACAAKGGDLLSGDSFSIVELSNGKFAVAISDGMGNGERARAESSTALSILQQLLDSGMDEKLAVKSVNSVLLLRSSDEMYATVDVAIIDQYSALTTFVKIGSTPSFIKRGDLVIPVHANNLPVGIIQDIDVDLITAQLEPGDVLVMMTDGIYDAPGHTVNKELWMKRMILELNTDDPQEMADRLIDVAVRYHEGSIYDDMTVVVAKVQKHKPEWASLRWPGMSRMERPRTVS
ncbi:stage II sporulation protein E [Paenibacillus swuensis]|uniref:Stage II sporulation protein E n=1 Tax=Paenibacillus swuensis TaxID=1178515 RepID=A0A172TG16_9BACL|nr:stage II sporulation protein E [Paenibacillus swuensis]ANE45981.1 stage II sporulation protein E [Paenibacillus swuensis]